MRADELRRILAWACASSIVAPALSGCCIFGRSYGPSRFELVLPLPPQIARQAGGDGSLSSEVCDSLCGSSGEGLIGCHVASLAVTIAPRPRNLAWKAEARGNDRWIDFGAPVPPDLDLAGKDPDHLDSDVCRSLHSSKDDAIRDCRLLPGPPAPPPEGTSVVQCHFIRPGGCDMSFGSGRDTSSRLSGIDPSATWIARAAHLERISIRAFAELARDLGRLGAPRSLSGAARRAGGDEVRHARAMTRIARARGVGVPRVRFGGMPDRSMFELAHENVAEGCVRELVGAAIALRQSRCARSAQLRATFARIARDETRHAALALRVFGWSLAHLHPNERLRLAEALDGAVRGALEAPTIEPHAPSRIELGLPDDAEIRRIVRSLDAAVFGPLRQRMF